MKTGIIFQIKELTLYEGNGLNIAVFMKGCHLDCKWCHNPESKDASIHLYNEKLIGESLTSSMLAKRLNQYARLQQKMGGYIIFSGGEPLLQSDFIIEVIQQLEYKKIAIDTSGYTKKESVFNINPFISRYYFDLKLADKLQHIKYTGKDNQLIIDNLSYLDSTQKEIIIRIPLINGITATNDNLLGISRMILGCKNIIGIELLEENPFTENKYKLLGLSYPLLSREWNGFELSKEIFGHIPVEFWRISDE